MRLEVKISGLPRDKRNILVMACPEPSLAGVVAVEYLIDALKMEEIGAIRITEMPPVIAVVNGAAKLPHRIFYSREAGIVAIRQHVPIPPQIYAEFIHKVLDWAEENKVKLVVCLSSMPAAGERESDNVYFVTEEDLVEKFKQYGFEPIKEATVAGLEGAYLDAVLGRNIDGALLIAESRLLTAIKRLVDSGKISTHRDVMLILNDLVGRVGPDVGAALKLINAVAKLAEIQIDTAKLQEHASKYAFLIEKNLEALFKPVEAVATAQKREIPLVF
ncbi:proteasome assembly chaperone family protein [Pyrobaculum ferrireducens]|uniref:Putative enzyme (ATP-grasp superfamily) n=1 Tax=Pyrobaculum ferrireducens TaxID=1104324 RepID=G7VI58_9CREN|nr:proteasome assembly chaperone family protein [Pyrobaculum ferrireducens]AET32150.1 putative enzyme (ATP-grasp superfamily) [Pyrobaculum ferrireducens]